MPMWVIRGGTIGEYETRFHTENKVYLTWDGLNVDLNKADDKDGLNAILSKQYPDTSGNKIKNWTDQIWSFIHDIKPKDWLVLPSRLSPVIHVGQIVSKYTYNKANEDPYYHSRNIKWIERDIPRSNFEQDVLYSLGGFNTIFNISQIQPRFKAMQENDWVPSKHDESSYETTNELIALLQEISRDQIATLIRTKFRGHRLAKLVRAIMAAKNYATHMSTSEGEESDIDILAARGGMGFDNPKICIQVKSSDTPVATLDQFIGTMHRVNAEFGLLVSWGGFKSRVEQERAQEFFKVRLWNQNDLIDQVLQNYDALDNYIKSEIPLKSFWTISTDLD